MQIREATLDDVTASARVHVDSWRTTYAGIIPAEYLAGLSYTQREERFLESLADPSHTPGFSSIASMAY